MNSIEILAGFKNALERGQSLEQAKISFLNAGYSQHAIDEASQLLLQGTTQYIVPASSSQLSSIPQQAQQQIQQPKKSKTGLILLIIAILLILGAVMGFIILFWDEISKIINQT